MHTKTLSLILHSFSLAFIISALSLDQWYCGGLFTSCLKHYQSFLMLAFVLDAITVCSSSLDYNPTYATTRLVSLIIGLVSIFSAILIYSTQMDRQYSSFTCTLGIVFAFQVAILNLFGSQCIQRTEVIVAE
uniref:MARVEL domain-containing protein n=1 Tax=Trichobilharzia regenti TaxID=157069 RepID=A0AA85JKB7_TRIRE|nr:unnamed protein product [Trichobilharzia regenti]